jgi:hypothetical protein
VLFLLGERKFHCQVEGRFCILGDVNFGTVKEMYMDAKLTRVGLQWICFMPNYLCWSHGIRKGKLRSSYLSMLRG